MIIILSHSCSKT